MEGVPVYLPDDGSIRSRPFDSGWLVVPGIGTGVAYADLDAFGRQFSFQCPKAWLLTDIQWADLDDEGINKRVYVGHGQFDVTSADNAALVISDESLSQLDPPPVDVATWGDANTGQAGGEYAINRVMLTPAEQCWVVVQTRGADNIAAGSIPRIRFLGLY